MIREEVEKQFQEYLVHQEPRFLASRSTRDLAILEAKGKLRDHQRSSLPLILSNAGAKKVINEEALTLTEKYAIQRADLGRGTYGFVYRAESPGKRVLVCKVTSLASLPSQYRFRLQSGFNILRFLQQHPHPNLVSIIEVFESPDKSYVFMDPYETDLFKRLKQEGGMREEQAVTLAQQVGNGLLYLHSIGVAHENLKPHHVLLRRNSPAVITGLGWAVVAIDADKGSVIRQKGSKKQKFHHDFAP